MTKKSLYTKEFNYSDAGVCVSTQTAAAVRDIFALWIAEGYSPREISQVMKAEITDFELCAVMDVMDAKKEAG